MFDWQAVFNSINPAQWGLGKSPTPQDYPDALTAIHASGRYDRSPKTLAKAMDRYVNGLGADIVSVTEVQNDSRARALHLPGRSLVRMGNHSGLRELAISYSDALPVTVRRADEVSHTTYTRVGGATAPPKGMTYIGLANGMVYATMHLPNTVGNRRFTNQATRRNQAYIEAVLNSSRILKDFTSGILACDFNARLGLPGQMRHLLDTAYARAGFHRVSGFSGIDGMYVKNVVVIRTSMLAPNSSSDHAPILLRFKVKS